MGENVVIRGEVAEGFESVAEVFGRLAGALPRGGGACVSVRIHGTHLFHLTAGDYRLDQRQLLFSVSKLVTSIALAKAEQDGHLDLDAPLSDAWSELRRETTNLITLRDVLAHRSGINGVDGPFSLDGFWAGRDVDVVARQNPRWQPGTAHGYHTISFGSLISGAVARATDTTIAALINELVYPVVGNGVHIGAEDAARDDIAQILFSAPGMLDAPAGMIPEPKYPQDGLIEALLEDPDVFNTSEFLDARLPSINVVGSAPALSKLLDRTIAGSDGGILHQSALTEMTRKQSAGMDMSLGVRTAFGSGVQLPFPRFPMAGPGSFGHEAAGGSMAFADPRRGLSIGFTTNVFPAFVGSHPLVTALVPSIIQRVDEMQDGMAT